MSEPIGAMDARKHFAELIDRAHRGEPTIVTRHGVPWAAIVPIEEAGPKDRVAGLVDLVGSGEGLWGDDPAETIEALRGEWE
jgi:prevent-host-death family protein